ncbi:extracellular solute-binding protein, family 3 [Aliiroseovarius crassostreae]|uniref:Solute-binding protein family 3/N-terminal domain-containing protein n=1 Tax=Aliiroseovarius crassostreae TaxID=154981 RepID=A0A0P7KIK5_9RHOB|nr:transporter substrate-binding domain-containing protein [Aliiroseovarius crassostreae]KPN61759.1 hypothetical protein AKJ29_03950 [Aliiroseovarius crassostreae]SFU46175.1 extracellular solute-binding protein, family 3 [Aliiroseovarius crassostreae]
MLERIPATEGFKGYEIDVITELAKDLEVELEFVPTDWKTLVNEIVAGKYHMTGSASISPSRMKVAEFSIALYLAADRALHNQRQAGPVHRFRLDQRTGRESGNHPGHLI